MRSCCAFAQADLNIFEILQVKTSETFTSEQRQLGSDDVHACSMNNGKILCELCAHMQVYL